MSMPCAFISFARVIFASSTCSVNAMYTRPWMSDGRLVLQEDRDAAAAQPAQQDVQFQPHVLAGGPSTETVR
jgi:hypothetical protein